MKKKFNLNFGLQVKLTENGNSLVYTRLYVVRGISDEFGVVDLGYYLKRSDAEDCLSAFSSDCGYSNVGILEKILFV